MLWMNWGREPAARPDMAYSVEDETYIALYGVWAGPRATTRANVAWATDRMREMEHARDRHPARRREPRAASGAVRERRAPARGSTRSAPSYDPDGRFHPWMGRP